MKIESSSISIKFDFSARVSGIKNCERYGFLPTFSVIKLKSWLAKFFKSTPELRTSRTICKISFEFWFSKAEIKALICIFGANPRASSSNFAVISSLISVMLEI